MTPPVSIIVPCYNEVRTIRALLEGIQHQTYPLAKLQVIVVDGGSDDGTRPAVQEFADQHPGLDLTLLDNPDRIIPKALNRGLEQAKGEIIVRLDAHAIPAADYVERSVEALERTGAANVGGVWDIRPSEQTWIARSIAVAASHPLGAGDARYRTHGREGEVDTVPFGAFRREWVEKVGRFDEDLISNEDYEFNVRIRRAGGRIWFDPRIRSIYLARPTLGSLARQYWRYGFWKVQTLRRHQRSLRWRQVGPPLFVGSTLFLVIGSALRQWARMLLALEWGAYGLLLGSVALVLAIRKRDFGMLLGFPLAIATMHLSWGLGFLVGVITQRARTTVGNRQA